MRTLETTRGKDQKHEHRTERERGTFRKRGKKARKAGQEVQYGLYEVASIALKILSSLGQITLPLWTFPLLTTKPPMTFVAFMAMAIFINRREHRLRSMGRTEEEYQAFLNTNRNSLQFSLFSAVVLLLAGTVDLMILVISSVLMYRYGGEVDAIVKKILTWGFGGSVDLIFLAPIMLLFSYTRTHKHKMIDTITPIAGVAVMAMVCIEGVFQGTMALKDLFPGAVDPVSKVFRFCIAFLRELLA